MIGRTILWESEEKTKGDNPFIVVRTKYFDDFIEKESKEITQTVLLGAGLDTRVLRLDLKEGNVVFEIDTPDVLEKKEEILKSHYANAKPKRVGVPADLRQDWTSALQSHGFDVSQKTLWVLEGLIYYLTEDTVRSIAREIDRISADDSKMIFDVLGSGLLVQESMASYFKYLKENDLPRPYCNDYPEDILVEIGWGNVLVDYVGSKTANFGRIRTFEQDMCKGQRHPMNSYFVIGQKCNGATNR